VTAIVECRGGERRLRRAVLDNIDLTIERGEIVALLGGFRLRQDHACCAR